MQDDAGQRATAWFLALSAVYFAAQALLRIWFGGTLNLDEAEMLLMTRQWSWGYGPQPPLYNWLQILSFKLFGLGIAGVVVLKDFGLWLAGAGMWFAMRRAFPDWRAAAAAALSLAYVPNIIFEFQRATSHSIALLVMICWTFWAWFRVMAKQDWQGWLVLGLVMGLGGLSKWNYWAVPAGLAVASIGFWQQRTQWRGPALAMLVAALVVALPYTWSVAHPTDSLASVRKLYGMPSPIWPWLLGMLSLAVNLLAGMALQLLIGVPMWFFAARGKMQPAQMATRIFLRAAGLSLAVTALLVVMFGVTNIEARWLVPIMIFATAAGFGWMAPALSPRAFRLLPVFAVICAAITLFGMIDVRRAATSTRDMTPLADLAGRLKPDRVESDFYLGGNLKLLRPDLDVRYLGETATAGDWPEHLLILGIVPQGVLVLEEGEVTLTARNYPDRPMTVKWAMVAAPS
jgi:4-amino-4-deoxy-L-arabinose transferase-like glycosyltransferase